MPYQTADFGKLYEIVTSKLLVPSHDHWRRIHSAGEEKWFSYLVDVFRQLFEDWERDPQLKTYLEALEQWPPGPGDGRPVHRVFRLAGHVYLHVAYDLVQGLAGTLDARPPVSPGELQVAVAGSQAFLNPPPVITRSRPTARLIFLSASPAFADALQSPEGLALMGEVSIWAKVFRFLTVRKRKQAFQVMSQWVLALRNGALPLAETIADLPSAERLVIVKNLLDGIVRAQTGVTERFRITDLELWGLPILSVTAPFAVAGLWDWTLGGICLIGVAFWLLRLLQVRQHQRQLLGAIDTLGSGILAAIHAARDHTQGEKGRAPG